MQRLGVVAAKVELEPARATARQDLEEAVAKDGLGEGMTGDGDRAAERQHAAGGGKRPTPRGMDRKMWMTESSSRQRGGGR